MILKLMDFLVNHHYLEMVEWAGEVLHTYYKQLNKNEKNLLEFIMHKQITPLIELLRKINYSTIHNETFSLILKQLEQDSEEIQQQWTFANRIVKDKPFLNIILNNHILIFQEVEKTDHEELNSLQDFMKNITNTNQILIGGNLFQLKSLSAIDCLQGIVDDTKIQQELGKYTKYERIVSFIEALELPLQELFSLHQIGVIIYQSEIYLVKWIQYLDEDQLISGKSKDDLAITVLEDFGITIGIQLKENLELGNLVIFSEKGRGEEKTVLRPLLSLNESVFSISKSKNSSHLWDLTKKEDCQQFVEEVLARIETGIMLLSKDKSAFVQNVRDLDLYIKISIQKVDAINSINQRINILRDLLQLNKNPDNTPEILIRLETNYIAYLKEQFQFNNIESIPNIIKSISDLRLFQNNVSLLVHTVVYLFDTYYADASFILKTVDLLLNNWTLTNDLINLLEKPQIQAITSIVIQKLNQAQFSEVISYLSDYLKTHPYFRSNNMIILIIQILVNIFKQSNRSNNLQFDINRFLQFLQEFIRLIHNSEKNLSESDIKSLAAIIHENFVTLSEDVDFIGYLNKNLMDFFNLLKSLKPSFMHRKTLFMIIENIMHLAPIVIFRKNLPDIGWQCFDYLLNQSNDDLLIRFFTQYVQIFTQSYSVLQKNTLLFRDAEKIFEMMKKRIDKGDLQKIFLLPFKREIISLFDTWYLSGNLPENDFDIHKKIIHMWVEFVEYKNKLSEMMNVLYIKDFLWACVNGDVNQVKQKYEELPFSVFETKKIELLHEMQHFLSIPFNLPTQFAIIHQIFTYAKKDYYKLGISPEIFTQLMNAFTQNFQNGILDIIRLGDTIRFDQVLSEIGIDFIFISHEHLIQLYSNLTDVYQYEPSEGDRLNARMSMLASLAVQIEHLAQSYDAVHKSIIGLISNPKLIISRELLDQTYTSLKEGSYRIFRRTQEWLIHIAEENYCTYEAVFRPVKILFQNILIQFGRNTQSIVEEIKDLFVGLFYNQKILNDNKKNFFRIMIELLPEDQYPNVYPQIVEYKSFIDDLAELESFYYTIKDRTLHKDKILAVLTRSKALIERHANFFSPWFFYANCLVIQEHYQEAINAYLEAMKYDSTKGNFARLIHNLLVAYMSLNHYDQAIELIRSMDIGIKTYPYISQLIRTVEQKTNEHLLA